ncbi:MAG: leucine-rich repeat domain-containing protein, partial [Ruminococcus sp.]|nr:leucine-rich repeat domain-containing protein [Ruminococcus sp.]
GEYVKHYGFRIYCYSGSAAEEYAIANGFSYGLLNGNDLSAEELYDVVEKIDGTAEIVAYHGTEREITIPSEIAGLQVTSIGNEAFMNFTSLNSVTIPEGVTSVGDKAFNGCKNLKTATLPETLESIGADAFTGSERLRNITIPKAVTSIGDNAFEHQYKYGSEVFIMRDFVINCYAVTEGYNYATENGYVYNVIPTGELKYQLRANDDGSTDVRFILIADEQEVLNTDSASVYATIDGTDTDAIVVDRAYRSIIAGGKKITADEGKVFLIGKFIGIPDDMVSGMTAHFTLGKISYDRTIAS